jgi:isopentenyldiphosphate isomerase
MQKRGSKKQTYPNFWDVSVAGHISSGETIHQGAIREIKEEIGLKILHNDLEFITIRKNVNKFSSGIIDCEFQHVFLAKLTTKIDNLNIQKEEIDDVRLFSFDEIIECQNFNNSNYKIVPADMTYYTYIIDIISKKNQPKSTQDQHLL